MQVYIHPPPAFKGYPRHSVFADSVVPNRVEVHIPMLNLCIILSLHTYVSKLQTWPAHCYAARAGGRMVVGWHKALLADAVNFCGPDLLGISWAGASTPVAADGGAAAPWQRLVHDAGRCQHPAVPTPADELFTAK